MFSKQLNIVMALAVAAVGSGCAKASLEGAVICPPARIVEFKGVPKAVQDELDKLGVQAPANVSVSEQSPPVKIDVSPEIAKFDLKNANDPEIILENIQFRAVEGVESFDFVRTLNVTLTKVDGSSFSVIAYDKSADAIAASPLKIESPGDENLFETLKAGEIALTVDVAGNIPTQPWKIEVKACFSTNLKANIDLL